MTNSFIGRRSLLPALGLSIAFLLGSCGGGGGTDPVQPTKGSIQVDTNIDGAAISLNGVARGETTDAKLSELEPGVYTVRVSLDGYSVTPGLIDVTVVAGQTVTAAFSLVLLETGAIHVESDIVGAAILLNGHATGEVTPADLADIAPGTYTVRVSLAGYDVTPDSLLVTVTSGDTATAMFGLVLSTTGTIHVETDTAGASILLDGQVTGLFTPADLTDLLPGSYTVQVSLAGYAVTPDSLLVTVVAGETAAATFGLEAIEPGKIHVETDIAGAAILLNGEVTGQFTPADITDLPSGPYLVDVVHAGYARQSLSVTVALDSTSEATFTLLEELAPKRVLVEHFSNYGCTPCLPAELALEAALVDLDDATVSTIGVHLNFPTFGDPFWLDNQQQNDDRRDVYNVIALPQFRFDGTEFRDVDNKGAIVSDVQARAAAVPQYQIAVEASPVGDSLIIVGSVRKTADIAGEERLVVAAIETGIDYDAPNGIDTLDDIVKRFFPGIDGLLLDLGVGEIQTFRYALEVSDPQPDGNIPLDDWVAENMHAVAFVQSGTAFTVYQAATTR